MRHLLIISGVLVLALGACIDDRQDTVVEHVVRLAELQSSFPSDMEVVVIDQTRDMLQAVVQPRHLRDSLDIYGRVGIGPGQPDIGPCSCDGPSCIESWVDENLGCNICVVFICDDQSNVHACNFCD